MSRLLTVSTALAAFALALPLGAAPAMAQQRTPVGDAGPEDTGEKINQLIVYGNDPCPASQGSEITVCARKPESERYRIPEPLRGVDEPQAEPWANKVAAYETVGASGINSCSPSGSGGASGCTQKLIDQAYAEKKNGSDVQFSKLIDAERQKRLATIDKTAAVEQKQVEKEEDAYFAAKKADKNKDNAAEDAAKADNATSPDSKGN
ncbi:hypothetical protein [Novosphingobium sp. 9]|uniref:hypothetical protein n=1 Tax=Novosphingobium sp. 9 TaxID=2025349 RepID=UPI0021B6BCF9|nr:hypothetical protein [Novosphingobium sp. 9]